MANPFEKSASTKMPQVPSEGEQSWGGRMKNPLRAANEPSFNDGQASPDDWSRWRGEPVQDSQDNQFGPLENQRTRELERQLVQYHELIDIYTALEKLFDTRQSEIQAEYNDDENEKKHNISLTLKEGQTLDDLVQRFVHVRPLINMTVNEAENELMKLLLGEGKEKIQNMIIRYLEYANIADDRLTKERLMLQKRQDPLIDDSDGEVTKAVQVNFQD